MKNLSLLCLFLFSFCAFTYAQDASTETQANLDSNNMKLEQSVITKPSAVLTNNINAEVKIKTELDIQSKLNNKNTIVRVSYGSSLTSLFKLKRKSKLC